jgi:hypothetical protein
MDAQSRALVQLALWITSAVEQAQTDYCNQQA